MPERPFRPARTAALAVRAVRVGAAVTAARLAASAAAVTRHRGTSLPGVVAQQIWPGIMAELGQDLIRPVLVVGTNGKTTTAGLLASVLRSLGREPLTNPSGANMRQGVVAAVVGRARLDGRVASGPGPAVLEVDELALPSLVRDLVAPVVLATNIFRDQLDRYGESDVILGRWEAALRAAPLGTVLVYCADDPRLEMLAIATGLPSVSFGLSGPVGDRAPEPTAGSALADPIACRTCGRPLEYGWRSIGHLGDFSCPEGHVRRPSPTITFTPASAAGRVRITLDGPFGTASASPALQGLFNAYNAAATVAAAVALGEDGIAAARALDDAVGPFGRFEALEINGRTVVIALMKNPVSLAATVAAGIDLAPDSVVLALNDAPADGRDVSWVWDASIAGLVDGRPVALTGSRADDLALRLKYEPAHLGEGRPSPARHARAEDALAAMIAVAPPGGTVLVVATYTAMMRLRASLVRRGSAAAVPR